MAYPSIKEGADAREVAARSLRSLGEANGRLANDHAFYQDVQTGFDRAVSQ